MFICVQNWCYYLTLWSIISVILSYFLNTAGISVWCSFYDRYFFSTCRVCYVNLLKFDEYLWSHDSNAVHEVSWDHDIDSRVLMCRVIIFVCCPSYLLRPEGLDEALCTVLTALGVPFIHLHLHEIRTLCNLFYLLFLFYLFVVL